MQQDNSAESPQIASILPWYVAYTKSRQEQRAAENLLSQGYAIYLPQFKLFKRVVSNSFCQNPYSRAICLSNLRQVHNRLRQFSTLGISSLVRFGVQLALVRQQTLEDIRAFEEFNNEAKKMEISPFKSGESVRVIEGVLGGLEGLISEVSKERVFVLLSFLGRETQVSLSQHQLMAEH